MHDCYTILNVAQYVIAYCLEKEKPVSNLALQKILYFLQKEHLRRRCRPLFPEDFEAWQFGPVSRKVYYKFCAWGAHPITDIDPLEVSPSDKRFMNPIIDKYYTNTPWDMVKETHLPNTAWSAIWRNGQGINHSIPKALIAERG